MVYGAEGPVVKTSHTFRRNQPLLAFEILTGDALFVDRISYHFSRPEAGDPFVFRTRNIEGVTQLNRGQPDDKYYIKRLAGKGGNELEVRYPVLYLDGQPAEGCTAFTRNAAQDGEYEGYTPIHRLQSGYKETVPPGHFYALGDNSDESSDSRIWGFVPEKEVIGKAVFIYYPFSHRWGLSE